MNFKWFIYWEKRGTKEMKRIRKILICILIICSVYIVNVVNPILVYAEVSGQWYDLGGGWRFRVDGPHNDNANAKWHVHVENTRTGVKGSEGVDGTASHKDHMNKIPKKVKEKIKKHPEYKRGKEKQKKLKKAVGQIKKKS